MSKDTLFTVFLTATAAAVSAVLGALLLRDRKDAELRVPYAGLGVAAAAAGLVALGLWMV